MPGRSDVLDYDDLAADYARHRRVHPGVLANLIATGRLAAEASVLEVGCGTGNYLTALHGRLGCRGVGIDPSTRMLAAARERPGRIAFVQGRAEALGFSDASFDLVYSVDVIHHVAGRLAFFREARRVLKPGGRLCTATDSEDDIRRRRPLSSHFPETVAVELDRYPRIATLRSEMEGAGFITIQTEHTELAYDFADIQPYRDRAFSSLHLIPAGAVDRGLARLDADLARGPIPALSLYTLLWGTNERSSDAAPPCHG
jgi:SAM-dependent methyltransferase